MELEKCNIANHVLSIPLQILNHHQ